MALSATMPVLLGSGHVANTTSYTLAWTALAVIVVRIGRTGETRWWLADGVVADLGAEDNHLTCWPQRIGAGSPCDGSRRRTGGCSAIAPGCLGSTGRAAGGTDPRWAC
jgi:hypothetical protein